MAPVMARAWWSFFKLADKGPVDLDVVEWEGPQVRQRRIAGAEIVQADLDACLPQLSQPVHAGLGRGQKGGLGQLYLQPAVVDAVGVELADDSTVKAGVGQVARGDVHGHLAEPAPGQAGLPAGGLDGGVGPDPLVHGHQQACFVGHVEEGQG